MGKMVKTAEVTQEATQIEQLEQPKDAIKMMEQRMNLIRGFLEKIMKKGVDYGVPGTGNDRFTLLKPGAEKLLVAFNLRTNVIVEDLSTPEFVRYRVRVEIISPRGEVLGVGIGECSSREEKYRWREAVCREEWDEAPKEKRRVKWRRGQYKVIKTLQVERDPFDVANTVLKMAKKRGLVDAVLTVLAVSDIFTQDEDTIEEFVQEGASTLPAPDEPLEKKEEEGKEKRDERRSATKAQINLIRSLLKEKGVGKAEEQKIIDIVSVLSLEEASKVIETIKRMKRDEVIEYFLGSSGSEEGKEKEGEEMKEEEEIKEEIKEEIF